MSVSIDINIYVILSFIATVAYIPLLVMTASSRPWQRRQELFLLFLVPGMIFGSVNFLLRYNFFPQYNPVLLNVLFITFTWVGVQFYCFVSSFFAPGEGRWLPIAYAALAAVVALVFIGYIPRGISFSNGQLYLGYGMEITLAFIPVCALAGRSLYLFWRRLKTLDNPVLYNQIVSLMLSVSLMLIAFVLVIFTLASIIPPWSGEFPIAHLINIIVAFILAYATIKQQLVDIRLVLRRGLSWAILIVAGAAFYALVFFLFRLWFGFKTDLVTLIVGLGVAALVGSVLYVIRGIPQAGIDLVFYRKTYDYRQKLLDFIGRIHNIFSLKELSGELLVLIVGAIKCRRACLLFPEGQDGDFIPRFIEPQEEDNPFSSLKIRHDNPIVRYLSRKHKLLTIQSLDSMPEFYGILEQERKEIKAAEVELFMPVVSRGKLVSILILSKKQSGRYLLEDISLLEDITSRVAVSIERGYLHEEVRQRQEELSVINQLAAIMTSSLDIREIYDNFVKELGKVVDVDLAMIALIEGEEADLLALSAEGSSAWQTGDKLPLKGTATEWVAIHKTPLVEPNLTEESRFWTVKHHLKQGIQSMVFFPLIVNDKVIGSLGLGSHHPNAYSQSQVQLLAQLASRIATPIENARLYAEAEQRARIDQLTGLWNRRHLEERIQVEIGRHSRYGGTFSLIILDLDFFKAFNDSYGHLAGDRLLKQLGTIMKDTLRATDEAFRYGGDEFAILLPQTTLRDAYEVAERVRDRVASEIKVDGVSVTASFGLASWPVDGVRINEVISAADIALYYAKQSGGNQSHAISEILIPSPKPPAKLEVEQQDRSAFNLICALAAAVDAKDHYAYKHSQKVREYAVALAKSMELAPADIARLSTCALLHDIGKIGISDEILNKAGKLTMEEWEVIRSHPQLGADIVSNVPELASCLAGILYHHEHYDGSGYPAGLKGEAIPLDARLLGIVDAFAAMTSARPYRAALSCEEAVEELKRGAGKQFDPNLVKAFLPTAQTLALVTSQEPG
jgi:diguanylate cyclase (GGDEF)-like protein/putative nucleotidyltransferase with HDIG domain